MKLKGKPDGSFLVRDSSDPRYILSLSFRSQGITHHTRMEHYRGEGCGRLWDAVSSRSQSSAPSLCSSCTSGILGAALVDSAPRSACCNGFVLQPGKLQS